MGIAFPSFMLWVMPPKDKEAGVHRPVELKKRYGDKFGFD